MREIGLLARERIYRRTLSGVDQSGAAFHAYSPGYETQKMAAVGRASPVNLQLSGAMLNAMTILEVTETSVSLGFNR